MYKLLEHKSKPYTTWTPDIEINQGKGYKCKLMHSISEWGMFYLVDMPDTQ